MNWTDFMIAIRQGLIQPVESEMLTTSILEKALTLSQGTYEYDLGGSGYTGTDLPNSNYKYSKATVLTKGKGGRATVILWGLKVGETLIPPTFNLYDNGAWSGWNDYVVKADLAKYLPLTGGEINGNFSQVKHLSTDYVYRRIQNPTRAVFERLAPNGQYWLYDETNGKYILESLVDGTNTFNGTASENLSINAYNSVTKNGNLLTELCIFGKTILHTGNMSSHVLPLTGGTVKSDSTVPIRVNSTNTQGMTLIDFQRDGASQGYLGFSGADNPIFYSATKGNKSLLHTGNSAKVHIGTSAPSDTSALWIDTSA